MRNSTKNKIMKNSVLIMILIAIGIGGYLYYNKPLSIYPGSYSESCYAIGNCQETCNQNWKEINTNPADCENNKANFLRENPSGMVSSCYSCDSSYYCADYSNVVTRSISGCIVTTTTATLPGTTTTIPGTTTTTIPLPPSQDTDYTLAVILMLGIGAVFAFIFLKRRKR